MGKTTNTVNSQLPVAGVSAALGQITINIEGIQTCQDSINELIARLDSLYYTYLDFQESKGNAKNSMDSLYSQVIAYSDTFNKLLAKTNTDLQAALNAFLNVDEGISY